MTTFTISSTDLRGYAWNFGVGFTYMAIGGLATYALDRIGKKYFPNISLNVKDAVLSFTPAVVSILAPAPNWSQVAQPNIALFLMVLTAVAYFTKRYRLMCFFGAAGNILVPYRWTAPVLILAGFGIALDTLYPS